MLDQNLWMTHFQMRERRLMQEAAGDQLANEYWTTRSASGLFVIVLQEAAANFRVRMTPQTFANKGTSKDSAQALSNAQPLMVSEEKSSLLAEAEEIVRSHRADPVE